MQRQWEKGVQPSECQYRQAGRSAGANVITAMDCSLMMILLVDHAGT